MRPLEGRGCAWQEQNLIQVPQSTHKPRTPTKRASRGRGKARGASQTHTTTHTITSSPPPCSTYEGEGERQGSDLEASLKEGGLHRCPHSRNGAWTCRATAARHVKERYNATRTRGEAGLRKNYDRPPPIPRITVRRLAGVPSTLHLKEQSSVTARKKGRGEGGTAYQRKHVQRWKQAGLFCEKACLRGEINITYW